MNEQLMTLIAEQVVTLMFLLISALLAYGIKLVKAKLTKEQEDLIAGIVTEAVIYVQQTMMTADNIDKLHEALQRADLALQAKNIKLNYSVLETKVEAHLKTLKADFGEAWKK